MLVLHVDDACFAGEGPIWEKAMNHLRSKFTIGKEEYGECTFLGRRVKQNADFTIELDQHAYVRALQKVHISKNVGASQANSSMQKRSMTTDPLWDNWLGQHVRRCHNCHMQSLTYNKRSNRQRLEISYMLTTF